MLREASIMPVFDDEPKRPQWNMVLPLVSSVTHKELVQKRTDDKEGGASKNVDGFTIQVVFISQINGVKWPA